MKMTLQHIHVPSTDAVDTLIEKGVFALQPKVQIDEAKVRVEWKQGDSPAFRASVHLVTPGPDIEAEGRDHSLRAAVAKMFKALREKVDARCLKRASRKKESLKRPAGREGRRPVR